MYQGLISDLMAGMFNVQRLYQLEVPLLTTHYHSINCQTMSGVPATGTEKEVHYNPNFQRSQEHFRAFFH